MKKMMLWFLSCLPLLVTIAVLPKFPMQVPMHYNAAGKIDRWGSKYEELIFPSMILIFGACFRLLEWYHEKKSKNAKTDKERAEIEGNLKVLYISDLGVLLLFVILHFSILYSAWTEAGAQSEFALFDAEMLTGLGVGIICIVQGNLMPKVKRNSLFGMRTVWSMKNDRTWAASQRVAGRLMMIAGILIAVVSLVWDSFQPIVAAAMGCLVIVATASIVYSYMAYRKYGKEAE